MLAGGQHLNMPREERVRLSKDEVEKLRVAGLACFGSTVKDVPDGQVVNEIAEHVIDTHRETLREQGVDPEEYLKPITGLPDRD